VETLRRARHYTSVLLAWFLVSLAATAFAAPMQGTTLPDSVCAVPGSAPASEGGSVPLGHVGHGDHCSLCPLIGAATGPVVRLPSQLPQARLLLAGLPPAPPTSLAAVAPLPPRGPPAFS